MTSKEATLHGYRHLLRAGLRAVQFSKPARFAVRDQLRAAFRERGARFDPDGVRRTVWFLKAAAEERGLEHRILKNLLRVYWERSQKNAHYSYRRVLGEKDSPHDPIKETAFSHYHQTIAMLNETMGLRLRG